jgi:hypothetical protein
MSTVFITGDRSLNPVIAANAVLSVISQLLDQEPEIEIGTGDLEGGVERAVRYFLPNAIEVKHNITDAGYVDFDERHKRVAGTFDRVVFIHPDPLGSRIGKSLVETVPESQLVFA